jgi:hypothetical protein
VADDHDRISPSAEDSSNIVGGRSRGEAIVGLGLDVERAGQLAARLARTQERAREDRLRRRQLVAHAPTELPGLLPSRRCQRSQLVRLSRRGFRVADEVQAHSPEDSLAAWP